MDFRAVTYTRGRYLPQAAFQTIAASNGIAFWTDGNDATGLPRLSLMFSTFFEVTGAAIASVGSATLDFTIGTTVIQAAEPIASFGAVGCFSFTAPDEGGKLLVTSDANGLMTLDINTEALTEDTTSQITWYAVHVPATRTIITPS